MKKRSESITVCRSTDPAEILARIPHKLPYPFTCEMLTLCKEENAFEQEYFYITKQEKYAFFILYHSDLNIFTLGHQKLVMKVKTIGFPCSLSNCGYVTNDLAFLLDFVDNIKGAKLILNVTDPIVQKRMVCGETLPTCMLTLQGRSAEEYLQFFRSTYRRRIRLALARCSDVSVRETNADSEMIHRLYLNTYEKSAYKLEQLDSGFFERADAVKFVFERQNVPVGFVMLHQTGSSLCFMFCGMDYRQPTADLYYCMLYKIIDYAFRHGCTTIDLGQTSEQTKMQFGAVLEKRYFYAAHSNPFLRIFARIVKPLLAYHYNFPAYRVLKDEKKI